MIDSRSTKRGKRKRTLSSLFVTVVCLSTTIPVTTAFPLLMSSSSTSTQAQSSALAVTTLDPVELLSQPSLDELLQQQRDVRTLFPIRQDQRFKVNRRRNRRERRILQNEDDKVVEEEAITVETNKTEATATITEATATTTTVKAPQSSSTTKQSTKRSSRSSTMPGFQKRKHSQPTPLQSTATHKNTNTQQQQQQQHPAQTLYQQSPNVPDSMIQFTHEIHTHTTQITRHEELELGHKTQAAVRLQQQYHALQTKLQREPTDEEWCAAAGKINMAAIRETLEQGRMAKQQLVTSNLRMVQAVVNTYLRNGLSAQYNAGDLMQEGIAALMTAAEKFEPQRGWKFSTYAMYWVRSSVKHNQMQQASLIWVPQRLQEQYKRVRMQREALTAQWQRTPTTEELAEACGMSVAQVEHCCQSVQRQTVSLDAPIRHMKQPWKDSGVNSLYDYYLDVPDSETSIRQDVWNTLSDHLDATQVELLWLRYGPCRSIPDIARELEMKPDQVRRLLQKSLEQLRNVEEMEYFYRVLSV